MGQRKMGRDVRIGWIQDPLRLYEKHYRLIAHCRRPYCEHKRELPVSLLVRLFPPETTTLGEIAALLRCSRCGMRGARVFAQSMSAPSEMGARRLAADRNSHFSLLLSFCMKSPEMQE